MKKNSIITGVALLALTGAVQMANANITFTATGTDVTAYYVGGDASDLDLVGMLVNVNSYDAIQLQTAINNMAFPISNVSQGTPITTPFDLGSVNVGDSLVFVLKNTVTKSYILSDSTLNDILNGNANTGGHDYITTDSTTYTGSTPLPSGTYVGFEDLLPGQNSDFDRNDLEFVFQNITPRDPNVGSVPEPTTVVAGALLLLPFGVSTLRILRNRKLASR
jgi:hypothetical protein